MIVLQIKLAPARGTSSLQVSSLPSVCHKENLFRDARKRGSCEPRFLLGSIFRAVAAE